MTKVTTPRSTLLPVLYEAEVEKDGFKRFVRAVWELRINDRVVINISLDLGRCRKPSPSPPKRGCRKPPARPSARWSMPGVSPNSPPHAPNLFFSNRIGQPRADFTYNRWGGTFSGPVVLPKLYDGRNKTFFMFAHEGIRQKSVQGTTTTVPTAPSARVTSPHCSASAPSIRSTIR